MKLTIDLKSTSQTILSTINERTHHNSIHMPNASCEIKFRSVKRQNSFCEWCDLWNQKRRHIAHFPRHFSFLESNVCIVKCDNWFVYLILMRFNSFLWQAVIHSYLCVWQLDEWYKKVEHSLWLAREHNNNISMTCSTLKLVI